MTNIAPEILIPSSFKDKFSNDKEVIAWNNQAQAFLKLYGKQLVQNQSAPGIASVAQLSDEESWLSKDTVQLANDTLNEVDPTPELLTTLLEDYVKPILRANPHPRLSLTTGRAMSRIAGGSLSSGDYLQEQTWKEHPGLANLVSWCSRVASGETIEKVWHLLVPPVMTFVDDHKAAYKLRGLKLIKGLLSKVTPSLLIRTGIGSLLFESLSKCLLYLHDPLSPSLLRETIPVYLTLTNLTTASDSNERFDRLSNLLGEHIIGGVWVYAANEKEVVQASMESLPEVMRAYGVGCVRYLKALIPQCVHCITPNELTPRCKGLELASLDSLLVIMDVCAARLFHWKGTIIDGVGRLWISLCDQEGVDLKNEEDIRQRVKDVFRKLSLACPSVQEYEYPQMMQREPRILNDILAH